jgi:hypothetical protein
VRSWEGEDLIGSFDTLTLFECGNKSAVVKGACTQIVAVNLLRTDSLAPTAIHWFQRCKVNDIIAPRNTQTLRMDFFSYVNSV